MLMIPLKKPPSKNQIGQKSDKNIIELRSLGNFEDFAKQKISIDTFIQSNEVSQQSNKWKRIDKENFCKAISPILTVARLFGILPLYSIAPNKLNFKIKSFRVFYSFTIILMLIILVINFTIHGIKHAISPSTLNKKGAFIRVTAGVAFYGTVISEISIFLWMSPRWIKIQREWRSMEKQLDSFNCNGPRLRCKFNIISLTLLFFAVSEQIIWIVNMISSQPATDYFIATWQECFKMIHSKSDLFSLNKFNFSLWGNFILFIVSNYAVFIWNFTDLFIMLVATGLAERYKCLNNETIRLISRSRSTVHWIRLRENYATLGWLVKRTDQFISPLILISFGHNLYFNLLQLSFGLSITEDVTVRALFPFITFAFVLARQIAVTLLAARIHDFSREVLPTIYSCSSATFTIEIKRLQQQLTNDEISLTGMKFFSLTRNFMLTIAGAIVTYEIILLQFSIARKE